MLSWKIYLILCRSSMAQAQAAEVGCADSVYLARLFNPPSFNHFGEIV
jgi:hypothetical protein